MEEITSTISILNSTSDLESVLRTDEYKAANSSYRVASFIIAWLILLLCIVGVIGNTFSIIIYCSPSMRSPINCLLAGLSFIDLALSLFSVPTFVIPGFYAYYGGAFLRTVLAYVTVYIYPIALTMQTASVWAFVVITIERWQTVARRSSARLSSVERARIALGIVCILAMAYNAVRFFEFRLIYDDAISQESEVGLNETIVDSEVSFVAVLRNATAFPVYMNVYYIGMFLVTQFVVPFTILVILNGLIVATICRSRKRRMSLNRRERSEQRTATMIIIVVATFIICYALLFSLNIMEAIDAEWFYDVRNMVLAFALNDISNLLVVANASTTIVVYYFFSSKYRNMLITMLARLFPCLNREAFLALRKPSMPTEDEVALQSRRRISASAGMHALFMVVARTAESKRTFLIRRPTISRKSNNGTPETHRTTFSDCLV